MGHFDMTWSITVWDLGFSDTHDEIVTWARLNYCCDFFFVLFVSSSKPFVFLLSAPLGMLRPLKATPSSPTSEKKRPSGYRLVLHNSKLCGLECINVPNDSLMPWHAFSLCKSSDCSRHAIVLVAKIRTRLPQVAPFLFAVKMAASSWTFFAQRSLWCIATRKFSWKWQLAMGEKSNMC